MRLPPPQHTHPSDPGQLQIASLDSRRSLTASLAPQSFSQSSCQPVEQPVRTAPHLLPCPSTTGHIYGAGLLQKAPWTPRCWPFAVGPDCSSAAGSEGQVLHAAGPPQRHGLRGWHALGSGAQEARADGHAPLALLPLALRRLLCSFQVALSDALRPWARGGFTGLPQSEGWALVLGSLSGER